jgi:hypothetical protein
MKSRLTVWSLIFTLLGIGLSTARAELVVGFSFPASVTELFPFENRRHVLPSETVTGLIFGLEAGDSKATRIQFTSGLRAGLFGRGYLTFDNSFTITDGRVSAATYAIDGLYPTLDRFDLSLSEGHLSTLFADLRSPALTYTSTAAPTFVVEPIPEPTANGLLPLYACLPAWLLWKGRARQRVHAQGNKGRRRLRFVVP